MQFQTFSVVHQKLTNCLKWFIFALGLICILSLFTYSSLVAQPLLSNIKSFAFGLGLDLNSETLRKLKEYNLVVIDGTDATESLVTTLKENNVVVLGYASLGTIERHRPWTKKLLKRYSLAYWEDWDEYFAAVSKKGFRRYFLRKIATPILNKGFDGLFLDNVDMISVRKNQTRGMITALKAIRNLLGDSRYLFFQNGDDIVSKIESAGVLFEGWNREDVTSTYDFDNETYKLIDPEEHAGRLTFVASMINKGYFVTTTDYVEDILSADASLSIANACSVGAIPFAGDIYLTSLPQSPLKCD